jgi:hypothetical protein
MCCAPAVHGAISPAISLAFQTVFYHFRQFRRKNTLHGLYLALHRAERERLGRHSAHRVVRDSC